MVAFALATALGALAVARAGGRWWPAWVALGLSSLVAELQGLGAQLSEAERAGVEIVAVSPDPNERSQKLAEGLRLGYRFGADRDLAVTRRYGLVHPGGGPSGQDVPRPDDVLRAVRAL